MKFEAYNVPNPIDTDKLSDVDALLLEECKKLQELFIKYNRQLYISGEIKADESHTAKEGVNFIHVFHGEHSDEEKRRLFIEFYQRLHWGLSNQSNGEIGLQVL